MSMLAGKRILVVDDESLIAIMAEEILKELGALPVGPASSVEEALALIEHPNFDAAMLDVNLNGKSSEGVARKLIEAGVPFVLVTGYGRVDWPNIDAQVLAKPYDTAAIGKALARALSTVCNSSNG